MAFLKMRTAFIYTCVVSLALRAISAHTDLMSQEKENKEKDVKKIIEDLRFLEKVDAILENSNMTMDDIEADDDAYNPNEDAPKEELNKIEMEKKKAEEEEKHSKKKIEEKKNKSLRLIVSENHTTSPSFFEESIIQEDFMSFIQSKGDIVNLKNIKSMIIELNSDMTDKELEDYITLLKKKGAHVESDELVGADSIYVDIIKEAVKRGDTSIDFKKIHSNMLEVENKTYDKLNSKLEKPKNSKKKSVFNDEYRNLQWGLDLARLDDAQELIEDNIVEGAKVCVVDSGIDYTHPDIKDSIYVNLKELNGKSGVDDDNNGIVDDIYGANYVSNNGDPWDDHNHGTHVAGIISAVGNNSIGVVGVNAKSKLVICKALDDKKLGRLGNIFKCIDYCISKNVSIINGSFSFDEYSTVFSSTIEYLAKMGILFVVSASNCFHPPNSIPDIKKCDLSVNAKYPSVLSPRYDNVLVIANLKKRRNDEYAVSINSFYSDIYCQVSAPGSNIYSTATRRSYMELSGTSMAAPHVAGIASIILSINPELTYKQVIEILKNSVVKLASHKNKVAWGGYVDILKAVKNAISSKNSYIRSQNISIWKKKKRN
ncbi:subtilisin-like protease 1, putative [Plasmodium vinckei brucechwatti]|uniref:Subtilisin-like protease 1 n=1 Tax=Plasmodium vinckei brucechwatti TaxID=119398 RepID=A0A6V7SBN1_PLAVN|nr:subtilisin-like protease 1, putative [Plasmodium vinckei brucechwatti]